jgi:FG-GAP-like repeat/Abnormal spindle-like microcephaly-assoc'd, ASPM-SPD-2-Hydin
VFIGKGDGTFATPLLFATGDSGSNLGPVFSADLNGDHKQDLLVSTNNGVSILLGDGNGSFQPYQAIFPGYSLLAVGDFNGDGKPDLVVDSGAPFVGIALGNGDGTFKAPQAGFVTSLLSVDHSVVGDFNGDGKLDFAFISSSAQTLSVLPGNGDGTFGQRIDLPTENSPWSLAAADFTGSGGLDLAVGVAVLGRNGAVSIYPNRPVGALYPSSLQFGSQTIGTTSQPLVSKLYNSGGTPLAISAIATTGAYAETNTCGASLPVGSSCTISVTFKPTVTGKQLGSISVKDSATIKPQTVTLSGVGVK